MLVVVGKRKIANIFFKKLFVALGIYCFVVQPDGNGIKFL